MASMNRHPRGPARCPERPLAAVFLIGVVFLVLISTVTGVKGLDPLLIKAAQDLGASRLQIFTKVVIPGALPNIFTGLRLGASAEPDPLHPAGDHEVRARAGHRQR